jgi:hypothetical protein
MVCFTIWVIVFCILLFGLLVCTCLRSFQWFYCFYKELASDELWKNDSLARSQSLEQLLARYNMRWLRRISWSETSSNMVLRSSHVVRISWRDFRGERCASYVSKDNVCESMYSQSSCKGHPCVQQGWSPRVCLYWRISTAPNPTLRLLLLWGSASESLHMEAEDSSGVKSSSEWRCPYSTTLSSYSMVLFVCFGIVTILRSSDTQLERRGEERPMAFESYEMK